MLSNILSSIDIFGVPVVINFSGQEKSKSKFGGVCSVLFAIFVVWAIYNGCQELFSTDNPQTVNSDTYNNNPREMILTASSFPIAVRVLAPQNLQYIPLDVGRLFTLSLMHDSLQRIKKADGTNEEKWVSHNVTAEKCEPKHFGEHYSLITDLDLTNTYCIPQQEISIQGSFVSSRYDTLSIYIYECNNITSNNTCATREEMDKWLEAAWFNMIYANMVIDPSNYLSPDSRFQDAYATVISPNSSKTTAIYLSHLNVLTDSGWLVQDNHEKEYTVVERITETPISRTPGDNSKPLMSCYFEVSKLESRYSRTYKKVQAVLAEVAGLANTFLVGFVLLTAHFRKMKFRETLMNEIFYISLDQEPSKKKTDESKQNRQQPAQKNEIAQDNNSQNENLSSNGARDYPKIGLPAIKDHSEWNLTRRLSGSVDYDNRGKESESELTSRKKESQFLSLKETPLNLPEEKCSFPLEKPKVSSWAEECGTPKTPNTAQNQNRISLPTLGEEKTMNTSSNVYLLKRQEALNEKEGEDHKPDHHCISVSEVQLAETNQKQSEVKATKNDLSVVRELTDEKKEHFEVAQSDLEKKKAEYMLDEEDNQNEKSEIMLALKKKSEKVTFTLWEYLSSFVLKRKKFKKKQQIIEEGIKNVNIRLDIVTILNKLKEIDKLRALILDQDQMILFNHLPKPELTIQDNRALMTQHSLSEKMLKRAALLNAGFGPEQLVISSYERIKHKQDKTSIDKKLIEMFNDHLQA